MSRTITRDRAWILAGVASIAGMASSGFGQFGGWGPVQDSFASNPQSAEIGVGDFDGDGLQDFVYEGRQGQAKLIYIRYGDISSSISISEYELAIPSGFNTDGNLFRQIHADDFNQDGIDDIALAVRSSDGMGLLRTLGANDRQPNPLEFTAAQTGDGPLVVVGSDFGDADGDGDLDFFMTADMNGGQIYMIENLGANQFGNAREIGSQEMMRSLFADDLDGDGRSEIVTVTDSGAAITIISDQFGDGQFVKFSTLITNKSDLQEIVSFGDFNNDGNTDILAVGRSFAPVTYIHTYLNDGGLGFSVSSTESLLLLNPQNKLLGDAADLDGDGDLDLLVPDNFFGTMRGNVFVNDGTGRFNPDADVVTLGASLDFLEFLDVDNNGSPDMIWSVFTGSEFSTALNLTDIVAPGSFMLNSPIDGAENLALPEQYSAWNNEQPEFRWSRPAGFSNTFDLRLFTTGDNPVEVFAIDNISTTKLAVPSGVLETGTEYEWFVTASNQAGSTDAMNSHVFTTAAGPRVCEPDLNGDGVLNFFDISAFINAFSAGCP